MNLSVAPNPFNKETKASFNLLFNASVQVELYDVLGRKLSTVFEGNLSSGTQEILLDETHTRNLTSGIYLLKLTIDGVNKTERIALN